MPGQDAREKVGGWFVATEQIDGALLATEQVGGSTGAADKLAQEVLRQNRHGGDGSCLRFQNVGAQRYGMKTGGDSRFHFREIQAAFGPISTDASAALSGTDREARPASCSWARSRLP